MITDVQRGAEARQRATSKIKKKKGETAFDAAMKMAGFDLLI